ncbi:hypothetical protein H696_01590 [Fonticula alba]|uniref:Biogenesis of lysosome-related organelles complex 1 subunit 6 n=1 Tax=Fonticula alba TaxID=691883 RepID=A0A058ZCS9_FONAL|nr:hypothetical protein H696_01590 [Fonticula alba]KCV72189.1 hypothetical protein H696_01590 [Fonticula alba]|eukprot:XP_009493767.1 hypothetical protein H696_01590 [Fonticula alba]
MSKRTGRKRILKGEADAEQLPSSALPGDESSTLLAASSPAGGQDRLTGDPPVQGDPADDAAPETSSSSSPAQHAPDGQALPDPAAALAVAPQPAPPAVPLPTTMPELLVSQVFPLIRDASSMISELESSQLALLEELRQASARWGDAADPTRSAFPPEVKKALQDAGPQTARLLALKAEMDRLTALSGRLSQRAIRLQRRRQESEHNDELALVKYRNEQRAETERLAARVVNDPAPRSM